MPSRFLHRKYEIVMFRSGIVLIGLTAVAAVVLAFASADRTRMIAIVFFLAAAAGIVFTYIIGGGMARYISISLNNARRASATNASNIISRKLHAVCISILGIVLTFIPIVVCITCLYYAFKALH